MARTGVSAIAQSMVSLDLQSVAVVKVDNRQFLIPSSLLRHHCPVLAPCLRSNAPLMCVTVAGIKAQTFKLVENYIRTGQFPEITAQNAVDLYTASVNLGITPLARKCQERIYQCPAEDQLLIYYAECERVNNTKDCDAALATMASSFRRIAFSKAITELNEMQLTKILDSEPVRRRPESERFIAALRWLQADCKGRCDRAKSLLSRFDLLDKQFIGCSVCREITKHVPALRYPHRDGQSELAGTPTSKGYESGSATATTIRSPTNAISGGGSTAAVSPETPAKAAHKTKLKQKNAHKKLAEPEAEQKTPTKGDDGNIAKAKAAKKPASESIPEAFQQIIQTVKAKARPKVGSGDGRTVVATASDPGTPKGKSRKQKPDEQARLPPAKSKEVVVDAKKSPSKKDNKPKPLDAPPSPKGKPKELGRPSPNRSPAEKHAATCWKRPGGGSPGRAQKGAADKASDASSPKSPADKNVKKSPEIKKSDATPDKTRGPKQIGDSATPKDQVKAEPRKRSPIVKMLELPPTRLTPEKPAAEGGRPKDRKRQKVSPPVQQTSTEKSSDAITPKGNAKRAVKKSPMAEKPVADKGDKVARHESKDAKPAVLPKQPIVVAPKRSADGPSNAGPPKGLRDRWRELSSPKRRSPKRNISDIASDTTLESLELRPVDFLRAANGIGDRSQQQPPPPPPPKQLARKKQGGNMLAKLASRISSRSTVRSPPTSDMAVPAERDNLDRLSPNNLQAARNRPEVRSETQTVDKSLTTDIPPAVNVKGPAKPAKIPNKLKEKMQPKSSAETTTTADAKSPGGWVPGPPPPPPTADKSTQANKSRGLRSFGLRKLNRGKRTVVDKSSDKVIVDKVVVDKAAGKTVDKTTNKAIVDTASDKLSDKSTDKVFNQQISNICPCRCTCKSPPHSSDEHTSHILSCVDSTDQASSNVVAVNRRYSERKLRQFAAAKRAQAAVEVPLVDPSDRPQQAAPAHPTKAKPIPDVDAKQARIEPNANAKQTASLHDDSPLKAPAAAVAKTVDNAVQGPRKRTFRKWARMRSGPAKAKAEPGPKEQKGLWNNFKREARILVGGKASAK